MMVLFSGIATFLVVVVVVVVAYNLLANCASYEASGGKMVLVVREDNR